VRYSASTKQVDGALLQARSHGEPGRHAELDAQRRSQFLQQPARRLVGGQPRPTGARRGNGQQPWPGDVELQLRPAGTHRHCQRGRYGARYGRFRAHTWGVGAWRRDRMLCCRSRARLPRARSQRSRSNGVPIRSTNWESPRAAAATAVKLVDVRASFSGADSVLRGAALDKYTFTRDAYLQRQRNKQYDGNPPEEASAP